MMSYRCLGVVILKVWEKTISSDSCSCYINKSKDYLLRLLSRIIYYFNTYVVCMEDNIMTTSIKTIIFTNKFDLRIIPFIFFYFHERHWT